MSCPHKSVPTSFGGRSRDHESGKTTLSQGHYSINEDKGQSDRHKDGIADKASMASHWKVGPSLKQNDRAGKDEQFVDGDAATEDVS